jgi:signal transduction histidine kinase
MKDNLQRLNIETACHDIKNIVISISGFVGLAREAKSVEEKDKYIDKAILSLSKLNEEISQLKKYKYQDGCLSMCSFREIYNHCKKAFPNQKISIQKDMEKIKILANSLIMKVITNFIDNSIRHGGYTFDEIKLSFKVLETEDLIIIYEDNGIGIPPGFKDKIFLEGFGENTGMGLYLVREILKMSNIKILETGEYKKGARFELTVPKDSYKIQ